MIVNLLKARLCTALGLTLLVAVATCPPLMAQEKSPAAVEVGTEKPTVVLAINSFEKLVPDLIYLTRATGQQSYGGFITLLANQYGQGLDRARPIGLSVSLLDDSQPKMFLMLPVKDLDTFFAANAQFLTHDELSENRYSLTVGMANIYAVYENQWLYVTQFEDDLAEVPANPQSLLEPLVTRYDLAVNVNLAAVPEDMKEQFLANLDQGFESAMANQGGNKSEEELEANRQRGEVVMQQLKDTINDTDQLLIGLNIDQSAKLVQWDFGSKFVEGSKLAKQTAMQTGLKSKFGQTAQPNDPIQIHYRSKLGPEEIAQAQQNLEMQLEQLEPSLKTAVDDPKAREVIQRFVTILTTSLSETIEEGEIDGCYAVNFNNGLNLQAMGHISQPQALADELLAFLGEFEGEEYAPKISGEPVNYKGMKLYSGTWKLPPDDDLDDLRTVVGETLPFVLAFGTKECGFAFGVNSDSNLKSAIDRVQSGQPVPAHPFDLSVELTPVLQYAETLVNDEKAISILQAVIAKATEFSNNDMFKLESRAVNTGIIARLTLEEGVLQAIGTAATASAAPPPGRR